jgi:ABC-type branched-subunit amino acid transport system permease subunit
MVLVFICLGLCFDLVVGRVGLLSLAHGAFFGIGAYVGTLAALNLGAPFVVQVLFAAAAATLFACVLGPVCFRLGEDGFVMGSLGFAMIAYLVAVNWFDVTNGPLCLTSRPAAEFTLGGWGWTASTPLDYYFLGLGFVGVITACTRLLVTGRIGRAWVGVREDEVLAASVGVSVRKYQLWALVISAAGAGATGAYFASYVTAACPDLLAQTYSTTLIIMLFVGGRGTMLGPVLGAILVTGVPEALRTAQEWRMTFFGVAIIIVILTMPDGLAPWIGTQTRRLGRCLMPRIVSLVHMGK